MGQSTEKKIPKSIAEFVEIYEPKFAAHPGELMLVIERTDDSGFRGGPGMSDPGPDMTGTVAQTDYHIAVIDSVPRSVSDDQTIILPIGKELRILGHGSRIDSSPENIKVHGISIHEMRQKLLGYDAEMREREFPRFEMVVGDKAVREFVGLIVHEREASALREAARKLGRPLDAPPVAKPDLLDESSRRMVDEMLAGLMASVLTQGGASPASVNAYRALIAVGLSQDQMVERCIAIFRTVIRRFLQLLAAEESDDRQGCLDQDSPW